MDEGTSKGQALVWRADEPGAITMWFWCHGCFKQFHVSGRIGCKLEPFSPAWDTGMQIYFQQYNCKFCLKCKEVQL